MWVISDLWNRYRLINFKPSFDFWHHNMSLKSLRNGLLTPQYESIWVFWHHNMSQYESQITQKWTFDTTIWVASPIYALLSVIRQQMSPFDPFSGGGSPKGDNVPFFYRFFFRRASLWTWKYSSNEDKISEIQPLIAEQRDNIQHDMMFNRHWQRWWYRKSSLLPHSSDTYSHIWIYHQ